MKINELIQKITPIAKETPEENVRQLIQDTYGTNAAVVLLALTEGVRVHSDSCCYINGYGDVPLKAAGTLSLLNVLAGMGVTTMETEDVQRQFDYPCTRRQVGKPWHHIE